MSPNSGEEHLFGTVRRVLKLHEVESLRRSMAMAPTLPEPQILELIETCEQLLRERVRIERSLMELGPSWSSARRALNDLAKILHEVRSADAEERG